MPTAREGFAISAASDGGVYVFGGRASPCCSAGSDGLLDLVERFDPATNSWSRRTKMPEADPAPGAASASIHTPVENANEVEGAPLRPGPIVYVFLQERVWEYDPAKDTWTAGPTNLSYGTAGSPVVGVDGIVRVFNCDRYNLYDPFMNHWQPGQLFADGRCHAVAVASSNGSVYVLGGDYQPSPGRSVLAFFAGGG
jgi:N-acetylneuraminic acid mutarotase